MSGLQIVITWIIFLLNNGSTPQNNTFTLGYGSIQTTQGAYASPLFSDQAKVVDGTLQFKPNNNMRGLRYGISTFYNENGTVMIGGGVSKTIAFKRLEFTTLFHPSYTYIGGIDNRRISFPINLRSSIDIGYRITNNVIIGGGYTHISNGTVTHPNNGLDIAKFTIGYHF